MNPTDIFKVANSVQNADFSDETTVRDLVNKLSQLANKPISNELSRSNRRNGKRY